MSSDDQPAGGGASVHIGAVHGGSLAFGDHGKAESTNYTTVVSDRARGDLLTAVRTLRRELGEGARTPEDDEIAARLDDIEGELSRAGRAERGVLVRLRDRLTEYAPAATTAASVTAFLQAVAGVLG
ncbi:MULTISPECIES: hypothetical protein [Streptomyces]|uniref:Uncharacterized protein n=2 Tax=Streptomyces TaxID=1883 RepID=A0A0W7X4Y2_9ACTN|nr:MULTISPECIES: hypothetical protein [Streptomyces]KUF17763.1 hypothetical protein AT728_10255 [Streptomyces silvensis]MVO83613.1 hypothetical protein [Streptomyces typhae]